MRVFLLHPEDQLGSARSGNGRGWDLVVDLGRAPNATYERWSKQTGCRVISLSEFGGDFEDLHLIRQLLRIGLGQMVDSCGIDWWDMLSLMIEPDLRQFMLIGRLARELKGQCELHASRSTPLATALQALIGAKQVSLESGLRPVIRWAQHYRGIFTQLDAGQIRQAFQDRFDREHMMRRRPTRSRRMSRHPVILLPSAYINVSSTAASYAALLPSEKFLLVYARNSAQIKTLPSNIATTSLDSYFMTSDAAEARGLAKAWELLRTRLISATQEFSAAHATGVLGRIPGLMRWGIAVRDAWNHVFQSETIAGCLCADDSNPYTRIPLVLARNKGIPTLACHHGALDSRMALKIPHADIYLAKSEIERDYLLRLCGIASEKVVLGGQGLPSTPDSAPSTGPRSSEPWLVFFTEPFQAAGWRTEEVYGDLLPKLWSLAQSCGLKLVFKLHPFESIKGHRRVLRKYLPEHEPRIGVIAGVPSPQLWRNTRVALTVQSTVAMQCAAIGIPVFFCFWLRDATTAYVEQFAKFGIGHILKSADELSRVPRLVAIKGGDVQERPTLWQTMDPAKLRSLLLRTDSLSEAMKV